MTSYFNGFILLFLVVFFSPSTLGIASLIFLGIVEKYSNCIAIANFFPSNNNFISAISKRIKRCSLKKAHAFITFSTRLYTIYIYMSQKKEDFLNSWHVHEKFVKFFSRRKPTRKAL